MSRTRLMTIVFIVCVVLCGGYAGYLWFFVGFTQGAAMPILGLLAAMLLVGGITWYVRKNE